MTLLSLFDSLDNLDASDEDEVGISGIQALADSVDDSQQHE